MSLTVNASSWPADWPQPNYEDPETRGSASLFIITLAITTVVVALRLYSRGFVVRSVGLDDALLTSGYVSKELAVHQHVLIIDSCCP